MLPLDRGAAADLYRGAMAPSMGTEVKTLLVLAAPVALTQLAQHGMSFVDALMLGRLGAGPLAAMALGATYFGLVFMIAVAFIYAVGPQVAQAVGAKDEEGAARALRQGLWLALLLAVPALVLLSQAGRVFTLTGQDPIVAAGAQAYLRAVMLGLPFALAFAAMRAYIEAHAVTRPVTVIAFGAVTFHLLANDVLIHGKFGLPALGVVGAGYSTALSYALMAAAALAVILVRFSGRRLLASLLKPDLEVLRELLRVGWPISLMQGFEAGMFSTMAIMMGRFGEAALAAHQVAMQMSSIMFMVPMGIGIAATIRVGQAAGRGDAVAARSVGRAAILLGAGFMCLSATAFLTLPRAIVGLYLDLGDAANEVVLAHAVAFLGFAAVFQIVDGVQVVAGGALRGLKDTRVPMLLTLVAFWFVGVPVGLVSAFGLGVGPNGLWYGLISGLAVAAGLLGVRFARRMRHEVARAGTVP